jgi:3-hydroxyisobutyrate dehydrogenase
VIDVGGPRDGIAFIGLGNMGRPMVRRLLAAGHEVFAHDLQPDARAATGADGATVTGTIGSTVAAADIVILMLPDSAIVSGVLHDPDVIAALRPGSVVVDMGSSRPEMTRELGVELAARGVQFIDAPVSGGVSGAERGTLAIMVGGSPEAIDRVAPALTTMGRVIRAGPLGAGHAIKSLNNLLSATHLWITSEAIVVGERFGLEPTVMLEIFNQSSGRSGSTENKWPNFILSETYGSGFGLRLMLKDIRIAVELAERTGAPHDLGEAVVDLWARAAAELPVDADHTEVARWIAAEPDEEADAPLTAPAGSDRP